MQQQLFDTTQTHSDVTVLLWICRALELIADATHAERHRDSAGAAVMTVTTVQW